MRFSQKSTENEGEYCAETAGEKVVVVYLAVILFDTYSQI